jgi:competence protein ComEC
MLLAAGASTFAFVFRRRVTYRWIFALLALASLGAARMQAATPRVSESSVTDYNDAPVTLLLRAVVVEPPVIRGRTLRATLEAEAVAREDAGPWLEVDGRVQLETTEPIGLSYGDRVLVRARFASPRNTPDYPEADVLGREGVFTIVHARSVDRLASGQADPILGRFYALRARALQALAACLPPEEAVLLGGVVLGADETMPPHLRQVFSQTGTTHILAVSGFNVALVAGTFGTLFGRWLGARRGALAAAIAIAGYTILVGAEPSAVRASLMAGLAMVARLIGRRGDALTSLAATGWLMTALRPLLISDIGFQLSFAATLGLVLYAEPLEHLAVAYVLPASQVESKPWVGLLREAVLLTLAAQLATWPLTAYHFGRLPAAALPANFLILPLQPPLMILGSLTAVAGMIWLPAGRLLGWITYPLAAYNIRIVEWFARIPLASVAVGPVSVAAVIGAYGLMAAVVAAAAVHKRRGPSASPVPAWAGLALLAIVTTSTWKVVLDAPDGRLHTTLFPSGDILIQSPTGRFVLLRPDSGAALPAADIGRRLPLITSSLDWMLVPSSNAADGFSAARVGARLFPRQGLYVGSPPDLALSADPERRLPMKEVLPGLRLDLGGGSLLEFLSSSDQGTVALLSMDRARLMIILGLRSNSLAPLAGEGVSGILSDRALDNPVDIRPWIVAAAGSDREATHLTTDLQGWVTVHTDGRLLWVETER